MIWVSLPPKELRLCISSRLRGRGTRLGARDPIVLPQGERLLFALQTCVAAVKEAVCCVLAVNRLARASTGQCLAKSIKSDLDQLVRTDCVSISISPLRQNEVLCHRLFPRRCLRHPSVHQLRWQRLSVLRHPSRSPGGCGLAPPRGVEALVSASAWGISV